MVAVEARIQCLELVEGGKEKASNGKQERAQCHLECNQDPTQRLTRSGTRGLQRRVKILPCGLDGCRQTRQKHACGGKTRTRNGVANHAAQTPPKPPTAVNSRVSVSHCRTRCLLLAPTASRMAISP